MRAAPRFLLPLLNVGWGKGERSSYAAKASVASAPVAVPKGQPTLASLETAAAPRLIVRDATLTLRVTDLDAAESKVQSVARANDGTVEASQGTGLAGPDPALSLTLRVPEGRFDATVVQLEGLGVRLGKTVSSEDVTDQAVDLDARLKSLRVQEDAYRAILAAARRVTDVLEVQERLTGVRTEIERIVAARRNLGDRAARSKIVVDLTRTVRPTDAPADPDWPAQTWGAATGTLRATGRALASLALWIAAMTPIWLPVVLVVAWSRRRKSRPQL